MCYQRSLSVIAKQCLTCSEVLEFLIVAVLSMLSVSDGYFSRYTLTGKLENNMKDKVEPLEASIFGSPV